VGLFRIAKTGKKTDLPGITPANIAAKATFLKRFSYRPRQASILLVKQRERMQTNQVRHMTMFRIAFLIVLDPFLDRTVLPDPERRQLLQALI